MVKNILIMALLALVFFNAINIAVAQTDELTKAKMGVAEILKNRVEIYDKRTKLLYEKIPDARTGGFRCPQLQGSDL